MILDDPAIKHGCDLAVTTPENDQKLATYLVGKFDRKKTLAKLAKKLPRYLVPSIFVSNSELPTAKNGKIDIAKLPKVFSRKPASVQSAKDSDMMKLVSSIWQCVVAGLELSSNDDNFFDAGGTSMDMLFVKQSLDQILEADISLVSLSRYPTVSKLANFLATIGDADSSTSSTRDRASQRRQQLARRWRGQAKNLN